MTEIAERRDAQRKKSRSRAFRNSMRLADEHAAMVEFLREVFVDGLAQSDDPVVGQMARGLVAEVDRP